jgi:hypothetical protein
MNVARFLLAVENETGQVAVWQSEGPLDGFDLSLLPDPMLPDIPAVRRNSDRIERGPKKVRLTLTSDLLPDEESGVFYTLRVGTTFPSYEAT